MCARDTSTRILAHSERLRLFGSEENRLSPPCMILFFYAGMPEMHENATAIRTFVRLFAIQKWNVMAALDS